MAGQTAVSLLRVVRVRVRCRGWSTRAIPHTRPVPGPGITRLGHLTHLGVAGGCRPCVPCHVVSSCLPSQLQIAWRPSTITDRLSVTDACGSRVGHQHATIGGCTLHSPPLLPLMPAHRFKSRCAGLAGLQLRVCIDCSFSSPIEG